jgi:Domain of unknown function (DU1801)
MAKKPPTAAARISDNKVAAVFASYSPMMRKRLKHLRGLILDTAANTPNVGNLEETLRWNEPAYLTTKSKSGSTIRINALPGNRNQYAMFFNCNTNLVDTFRTLFPDVFRYDGDRAIVFEAEDEIAEDELRLCIAMALTYHQHKKR